MPTRRPTASASSTTPTRRLWTTTARGHWASCTTSVTVASPTSPSATATRRAPTASRSSTRPSWRMARRRSASRACGKPGPSSSSCATASPGVWRSAERAGAAGYSPPVDLGRVGIWTAAFDAHPSAAAQAAAVELEGLGYRTLWLNEATGRDPFVMAGLLLSATSTLTIALGIANIYARDAMTTAAAQKTLAEAYPDRFLLGLGVSSPVLVEKVRGHDYGKPLSYMTSYLEAMDRAPFNAVGPSEAPPRVLAALGPRMLELSAARANGAHPYLTTPDHTRTAREIIGPD